MIIFWVAHIFFCCFFEGAKVYVFFCNANKKRGFFFNPLFVFTVCDFETYLLTERHSEENTIAKYMQMFKHIVGIAIKYRWICDNPFSGYKIHLKKSDRGYLTQDEIEILMKQKFTATKLERSRDVFVFCCFTGLSYIDVKRLTADNIKTSFDGGLWIMGKRRKTDVAVQYSFGFRFSFIENNMNNCNP